MPAKAKRSDTIPPGAGVAGVTLWSKERREAWFAQVAKRLR